MTMRRTALVSIRVALAALVLWWLLGAAESGVGPSGWPARARSEMLGLDGGLEGLIDSALHLARGSPGDVPVMALVAGRPARWSCSGGPIRWEVDRVGMPADGVATVRAGLARISRVAGLRFAFAGLTTVAPAPSWRPSVGGPVVLVGWVNHRMSPMFAPPAPADAVGMTVSLTRGGRLVGAAVGFDAAEWAALTTGFGAGVTQGELTLHELEHVVGIGDQRRWPGDLSYQRLVARPRAAFGAGDLTGLRELGCPGQSGRLIGLGAASALARTTSRRRATIGSSGSKSPEAMVAGIRPSSAMLGCRHQSTRWSGW